MDENKHGYFKNPLGNVGKFDKPGIFLSQKFPFIDKGISYIQQGFMGIKNVRNAKEVLPRLMKNNGDADVEFRDGSSYRIPQGKLRRVFSLLLNLKEHGIPMEISPDFNKVRFNYRKKNVVLEGQDAIGLAYGTFFMKEYAPLSVFDKTVVDIGANVGDTAICFALSGAKKVVAFEPYPHSFALARKNVRVNGLESRITLVNAAVGSADSSVRLSQSDKVVGGSQMAEAGKGEKIRVLSLGTLVKKYLYSPKEKAVLKIDCEGYEYDILLSAPKSDIRAFEEIMLEFHYGQVNLKKKLEESGFSVSIIKPPRYFYCNLWKMPHGRVGLLHAKRVGIAKEKTG